MQIAAGARLGPYEILSPLGAGGMGEVYRAKDTRLAREVALKVLPEEFFESEERRQRFEREARTLASLSHPCIAVLYSFEEIEGRHILTMELLEGESLRAVIARGALPARRALEISEQIAQGLAAAHEMGIVHRDVKPENVFVTKDGHVKLLDFGLARAGAVPAGRDETESPTVEKLTTGGAVVGTVAYMSPEQARGLAVDHRSDQFSLGVVLYEMLAGRRPFKGGSAVETLTAIIREEPEPLSNGATPVPAPVRWIVERCLAKEPGDRYDSTRDLARELASCRSHLTEALSGAVGPVSTTTPARRRTVFLAALGAAGVVMVLAGGIVLGRSAAKRPEPKFQRLTFKRGYVTGARFAPDGRTVVYSAAWDGQRPAVYSVRLDALDSVPSGYAGANLLAVSSKSQLALSLQREGLISAAVSPGTLAMAPFAGGTPRAMEPDVSFADFSSDGEKLVVAKGWLGRLAIEYPPGNVLYKSAGWWVSNVRLSPSGELVAFLEHPTDVDTGYVVVVDRSGKTLLRKGPFFSLLGLAWSARGDEIWFGGNPAGNRAEVRAVTPGGRERVVFAAPVPILPLDVAADGRLLAVTADDRVRLFFHGEAAGSERELSAQGSSGGQEISPDGAWVAFSDNSLKGVDLCYLRSTSGAPPVELGEAEGWKFSPDSHTLVVVQNKLPGVLLQPVDPGQPTKIRLDGFEAGTIGPAGLLPGGKAIWFKAKQPSRPPRIWEIPVSGGEPHPLTPEGVGAAVTDDGTSVFFWREGRAWIRPLSGGDGRPVGLPQGEWPAAWTTDGRPLFVCHNRKSCPAKIYRLDPQTGKREFFSEIGPSDASGVYIVNPQMSRDGKACVYQVNQILQELHVIEGLK